MVTHMVTMIKMKNTKNMKPNTKYILYAQKEVKMKYLKNV